MRLIIQLESSDGMRIALPSAKYPSHTFRVGRFEDVYGPAGFSRVLTARGVTGLSDFFHPTGEEVSVPHWAAVRATASQALDLYEISLLGPSGDIEILCVRENSFTKPADMPRDEMAARRVFAAAAEKANLGVAEKANAGASAYGTEHGVFYPRGITVVAAIAGHASFISPTYPCTYLAVRRQAESLEWYRQAIEIIVETCDFVLRQPDVDGYRLLYLYEE